MQQLNQTDAENTMFRKTTKHKMKVLVVGLPISPETPFDIEKQYKGELDNELRRIENILKDFENKHNLILKYKSDGCEEELGCIIFMQDVNLETS